MARNQGWGCSRVAIPATGVYGRTKKQQWRNANDHHIELHGQTDETQ